MNRSRLLLLLLAATLGFFAFSALLGRYPAPGLLPLDRLPEDELAQRLVFHLRLPRLLAALLLGMTLSAAGMVFQLLFSNPLVEPGFLGVSQGAAFGAAFAIVFLGGAAWLTQVSAIGFALAGLAFSYLLARRLRYGGWILRLVLAGIAVSALFSAGVGLLSNTRPTRSPAPPEITFWLLGGLASITRPKPTGILPLALAGLLVLYLFRWRLNLLSLNDQTSFSLGLARPGRTPAAHLRRCPAYRRSHLNQRHGRLGGADCAAHRPPPVPDRYPLQPARRHAAGRPLHPAVR